MDGRLTITDVAKSLNVTPRTLMRWEKAGKIKKSKRDWRGWRFYTKEDMENIRKFYEGVYDYETSDGLAGSAIKNIISMFLVVTCLSAFTFTADATHNFAATATPAAPSNTGIRETPQSVDIVLEELPAVYVDQSSVKEPMGYTLGPNDIISVEVRRHPMFGGQYEINAEGKIGYRYIGDLMVSGLTKEQVRDHLTEILSEFILNPEVDVQIVAYLSKVFYVVGEVGRPGKFFMKGDTMPVREAIVQAGLPTQSAKLKSARLITPNETGRENYEAINLHKLLYEGDLSENLVMQPGDVLYVPSTLIAKVLRVIYPYTNFVAQTGGTAAKAAVAF